VPPVAMAPNPPVEGLPPSPGAVPPIALPPLGVLTMPPVARPPTETEGTPPPLAPVPSPMSRPPQALATSMTTGLTRTNGPIARSSCHVAAGREREGTPWLGSLLGTGPRRVLMVRAYGYDGTSAWFHGFILGSPGHAPRDARYSSVKSTPGSAASTANEIACPLAQFHVAATRACPARRQPGGLGRTTKR